jgi:hypothetical protein
MKFLKSVKGCTEWNTFRNEEVLKELPVNNRLEYKQNLVDPYEE